MQELPETLTTSGSVRVPDAENGRRWALRLPEREYNDRWMLGFDEYSTSIGWVFATWGGERVLWDLSGLA
jgi:hypothetical protein